MRIGEPQPDVEADGGMSSENADDRLTDLLPDLEPDKSDEFDTTIRPELVEKVFKTLSADAERGEGSLQRADVNRIYLRRNLSIPECGAVEEKLISAGYRIFDEYDDETDDPVDKEGGPKRKFRFLSESEERELGRRIQLALKLPSDTTGLDPVQVDRIRKDADRAKAAFVASNIRYVEKVARRMGKRKHLTLDDIMQEGAIGLLRAADLYDPERGFRFKTYATWWIEQRMRRSIADDDRIVRLPVHLQEKLLKIKRAKARLTLSTGHAPSFNELATAVGLEPERLEKLLWHIQATDCVEGDAIVGEGTTLLSLVPDSSESAFDSVAYQELQRRFSDVLATLTPREERVLRMRFGIGLERDHTLESVGQHYNVTRERIRQIEAKALKKLQHASRKKRLLGFLES